jgi:hypothetical protein
MLAREIVDVLLPYVVALERTSEQHDYVGKISLATGIPESVLWDDLKKVPKEKIPQAGEESPPLSQTASPRPPATVGNGRQGTMLRKMLGVLYWQEGKVSKGISTDINPISLREKIGEAIGVEHFNMMEQDLGASHQDDKEKMAFEAEVYYQNAKNLEKDLVLYMKEDYLKGELMQAMGELSRAEKMKDVAAAAKILARCQELSKALSDTAALISTSHKI